MNVNTLSPADTETFLVVPGPLRWDRPKRIALDDALQRAYKTFHVMGRDGPSLVYYQSRNDGSHQYPINVGEVVVMSDASVLPPTEETWKEPYAEAIRQREKPEEMVFHGTNIESLLPVIENGGLMRGSMRNWFSSHYLEKAYHENPELKSQIQRPRDSATTYAGLGKYDRRLKHFVPVTLRFLIEELPELEVMSRLDGNPEHYRTKEDVPLSALTMGSKVDLISAFQTYQRIAGERPKIDGYRKLAYALGFSEDNFFVKCKE